MGSWSARVPSMWRRTAVAVKRCQTCGRRHTRFESCGATGQPLPHWRWHWKLIREAPRDYFSPLIELWRRVRAYIAHEDPKP